VSVHPQRDFDDKKIKGMLIDKDKETHAQKIQRDDEVVVLNRQPKVRLISIYEVFLRKTS
jgi:hypothetical protein